MLSTMLKKQKLMHGYAVADEILGSIGYATKLNATLAQQPAAKPYTCDFCGSDYTTRACCAARYDYLRAFDCKIDPPLEKPAVVDGAWQVQLADALECFWNPAIEGSGDDRSNIIGGMVQGFAAVAYRLREHAALAAQPGGSDNDR